MTALFAFLAGFVPGLVIGAGIVYAVAWVRGLRIGL